MDLRLAVISVLITYALSVPVKNLNTNTQCSTQCTSKNKFGYRVGTIYEYTYEAETKTGIQGATEEQGGLKVTATAEIEVLSKCELLLSIKNANVLGSDPDYPQQFKQHPQYSEFRRQLTEHPLRFSFQDGIVEDLCSNDGDSDWSVNIKRGILTAFQNSMDSFDMETEVTETDVSGKCPTTYRVTQEGWKTIKIKKNKDLVACSNRHGFQTSAQATIYTIPSSIQSLPLLKSTQECDQILSTEGRVESTVCHELHLFRPFAKGNNGAMTEVVQRLKFVTDKRGGRLMTDSVNRRESLLYKHHVSDTKTSNNKDAAINKLNELCSTTKDGITTQTPRLFAELVYILKEFNSQDLTDVYEQSQMDSFCIENSERVKKFFNDAVPMIGTTAAVKQIAKLILRNEITGKLAEIWLSSLSLVQNPSREMLSELSKLMDLPEGIRVYLPASVMVNTYCRENANCENIPEVEDIISRLQKAVGSSCIVTEGNYVQVLTSLRAIGNLEYAEKLVPTINECMAKKNEMEIRVTAVEAYRRMSCGADRNNLMILYRDDSEDSELRIAAYIQVMKCPTENIISQVKDTLSGEEVNQVGSFVWTHLTNLMESSSIHKQEIQKIMEDETLKKEFDLDKRKFSRNYEWSYFSEGLNAGAGLESNLVWSQKSFVPRSAMVNLTVDLFGHSVNLVELGGRVEGIEKMLADNFGPKGYSGAKQDFTDEQKKNRDVDFNKIQQIDEKLGQKEEEMKGSMFMRVFGNEISYYNTKQSSGNDIPNNKPFNFLDMFMSLAKEQEHSQKMSKILIDSSIITPTVTGLPLNLKVLATSTVDMNAKGKMDLRSPSKKIILEGSLNPSGAVEVSSMMSVDAFVTKSGLKMLSTFHTSTAVSAKFELDQKQELTMEFSIPKETSELVDMKSQFFVVHADLEKEQKMSIRNKVTKKSCSGATLARVTGVEFCVDMAMPGEEKEDGPHYPLTGPSTFSLKVHKRDTHTSYKFDFKNIVDKKKYVFTMMYDTPGSEIMRKTGLDLEINHDDEKMEMNLISPWKTAKFEGNLQNKLRKKEVIGVFTVDSSKVYQAKAEVNIAESKSLKTYKPSIEILRPNAKPMLLSGEIVYRPGRVLTSKLILAGVMEKPSTLDLSVRFTKREYGMTAIVKYNKDEEYNTDVNLGINEKPKRSVYTPRFRISTPKKEIINVIGKVDLRSTKGDVMMYDLSIDKIFNQAIKIKGDARKLVKGKRNIYRGKIAYTGPQKTTTRVRYQLDKKLRVTTTALKVDYNFQKVYKDLKDSLQLDAKFMKKNAKNNLKTTFYSHIKSARFAEYNNQVNLKIDHRPQSKLDADLTVDYGKTYLSKTNKHRLSVLTDTKYNFKSKSGAITYNVTFKLPAEKLDSYISGKHKYSQKDMKSDLYIRYDNKKYADISVSLLDASKKTFKYSGDIALKYPGRHMQLTGLAVEKDAEYFTKWTVQHEEGHESNINAAYSWPSKEKRDIDVTLKIDQQPTVTLSGNVNVNENKPEGTVKVKVGKDFYVVSAAGDYDGETYAKGQGKISYPSRQIILDMEGGLKGDEYSGKFDVDWDSRSSSDSRVVVGGSFRNNTINDFAVSAMTQYPGRELSASIQHLSKDKIDTTVSVGWNKNQVISTTIKFEQDIRKYRQRVEGSLSLTTPFKQLEEFEIGANHEMNKNKFEIGSTFTWNKGKTVAFQYDTKRPVDISDLEMNLQLKTPLPELGNPTIKFENTLSNNLIQQKGMVKVTWGNNKYVTIDTDGETDHKGEKRIVQRNVKVFTSFENYKNISLKFTHEDDLKKFLSKAVYVKDDIKYLYVLDMDHSLDGWNMQNSGSFDISSPYDSLKIIWNHKNSDKHLETTINTDWGKGQKFYAKATGQFETFPNRKITTEIVMEIPSAEFSNLNIRLEHEDKAGYVKTLGKILVNRENVGTAMMSYARQLGSTDFEIQILSKHMEDFIIDCRTRHAHMPLSGTLKVEWNPKQQIILDGEVRWDHTGTSNGKLEFTSPFQLARRVVWTGSHKMDRLDWVAESEFEFAPMRKISAELRYNKGPEKLARLVVSTPFPHFQKLTTGAFFKFVTYPDQWENKLDFELVPLVGKISTKTEWQYNIKTKGSFRIDTPFNQVPFMAGEVESEKVLGKRTSKLMLEYLPTQKIEMTSTYKLTTDNNLEGSISLKTPFNDEVSASYNQAGYAKDQFRGYSRRVHLKYRRTQNVIVDTTFGTKPKLFGSMEIQMPVRGYETVKLAFTHRGKKLKDFHTTAEYETNGKKIELETLFDIINDIRGKFKLTSPFSLNIAQLEYSHEGRPTNFKTHGGLIYNEYVVNSDAVFTHNDLQTTGSFTFKSPIYGAKDIMVSFNRDGTWKKLAFDGEAGYESGKKYIVAVKHSFEGKDASTDIVIQSPELDDIILKVSYDNRKRGFTTILKGSVGTDNSFTMETAYKLKNYELDLYVDLTTVLDGKKNTINANIEHKGELGDFSCKGKLDSSFVNLNEELEIIFKGTHPINDVDAVVKIKDTMKPITITAGYKSTKVNNKITSEANYNDISIKSEINGQDLTYEGKIIFSSKVEGYEKVEMDFNHKGSTHGASNLITVTSSTHKPITLEADIDFTGITSFGADITFKSDIEGYKFVEGKVSHKGNLKNLDSSITVKKTDMEPLIWAVTLNAMDMSGIDGTFKMPVSLSKGGNVEGTLKHRGDMSDLLTEVIILVPNRKPAHFNVKFVKNLPKTLEGEITFTSDLEGAEKVEFSLMQTHLKNENSLKFVIQPPFVKPINFIQQFKNKDNVKEITYKFTSGFKGMESVHLSAEHKGEPKDFVNTISVYPPFMDSQGVNLVTVFKANDDYTSVNGDVKFSSQIKGAEDVRLTLVHNGQILNFDNKLTILPPFMDQMDLSTDFKFEEKQQLKMTVNFNSKIPGAETLGFSTENKLVIGNSFKSQSEIKLDPQRKITLDADVKLNRNSRNQDMDLVTKVDLATPFEKIQSFGFDYGSSLKTVGDYETVTSSENMLINYNGEKYWHTEAIGEMEKGTSYIYKFDMNAPWKSEFNYDIKYGEPYAFDIMANWNKMDPSSKIKMEGELKNMNDFKVKVSHVDRTAGLEVAYSGEEEKEAKMVVTWDEAKNQAVGVKAKWEDQNRRGLDILDGSVTIITPYRSVEASGSINRVLTRKSVEGTVFWDAEKDREKKVSVRSEMTPEGYGGYGYNGMISLSLPVINKELTLTRQLTQTGRDVLYETKTEFSYSKDASKTIVFKTKLEDLSASGSRNYSYTVGVSQAYSRIDTSFNTHLGRSEDRDTVGMLIKYQTSQLKEKNLLLLAEINKLEKKIILQAVGPQSSGGIIGQIKGDSPVTVSIRGLHGLKDSIETDITIDKKKKAMEVQMKYDRANPNNVLNIAAKYPSKTNLDVQVYRTGDKKQVTDAVIKVNLRTSRILHSKINWRPDAFNELMDYGVQTIEKYGKAASDDFRETTGEMENEMTTKYTVISKELDTELKPYIDGISDSLLVVQNSLNKLRQRLNKMYQDNDMYLKDVTDGVRQKSSQALEIYKKAVVQMRNAVGEIRSKMEELKNLENYPFEQKYREYVNEVSSKIQTAKQELVDMLTIETATMRKRMKETVESMRKDIQEFTDKIRKPIMDLLEQVMDKAEIKELISYIDDILKNLPESFNIPEIDWDYYLAKIHKTVKDKLEQVNLSEKYNEVVEKTKEAITNQLGPIMKDEKVQELTEMAKNLHKKLTWAWEKWNFEKALKSYLIEMYNELQTYVKEDIAQLKFLHLEKNRIIAFDPENGNIEFEMYLPTPSDTLETLPKFSIHKYVQKVDKVIEKIDSWKLPELFDFSIWDFYYKYKPSWNPNDWIPPFDTFALVAGNQHFITFDGKQIDFAGRCSYILAKDMLNNKFTVIMNYEGRRRPEMKSLIVLSEGKSVEIFPDFSVKLDNRPTDLPIKHHKLSVIRDGNLIQVDTGRGLVISGNLANQHIAFVLSGWYYGQVGGLLGSYNNEQYDDMIDSTGGVTKDINVMAQTWEVADRCRNSANIASDVKVEEGEKGFVRCNKLFGSSDSTLRPCFKVIDPTYFMKVCMSEMQTSKGDGCNAVSAYVRQCRQNDVMIWIPKMCVSCTAPNKELFEGAESIKISPASDDFHAPKSADIVMVVEEVSCNSNPVRNLGDLVDKLDQALIDKAIVNNRFGLVGFGGTPRPGFGRKTASLAHTFEGSIFSESNNFAKGKETLNFAYHFTDPLEALLTAADMPFRTGVSKTIVLLHCGECADSKNVNYDHIKYVLSTRDITLHIIRDQEIRFEGNSSPKDVIMGFDSNNKYMMKPLKDMSSKDIHIPEDSCVDLSLMTGGSLFHSSGLTDSKHQIRKWFLNTVSQRITETATPTDCQVCQCVADHTGMAKSICRKCYSSVSDYVSWWDTWKHPSKIQDQFEKQYKDYFGDDSWKIFDQ